MPTPQEILDKLRSVPYPGYTRDIVSFGIVKDVEVGGRGVAIVLVPASDDPATNDAIQKRIDEALAPMEIGSIEFRFEKPPPKASQGPVRSRPKLGDVRRIVAVASGKGGVGKSTVAVNLALALAGIGRSVGLLDADVYGPSVPTMLGLTERPRADEEKRILPLERFGLKAISMGLFIDEAKPIVWRGPMVTKLLVEFFQNVIWGDLDYLVLDLPPGTGDAQLTICQNVPLDGGLIVTTPSEVALLDVGRGVTMFQEAKVPVLGVVENMARHVCRRCGHETHLFGAGAEEIARRFDLPILGSLPLVREIREGGDAGRPIVIAEPEHPGSRAFFEMARRLDASFAEQPGDRAAHVFS